MQISVLILLALLTSQVADPTGSRYSDPSGTLDTAGSPTTNQGAQAGDSSQTDSDPTTDSTQGFFDALDRAAQPLGETDDTAGQSTDPAEADSSTRHPNESGAQPTFDSQSLSPQNGTQPSGETQTPPSQSDSAQSPPQSETDPGKLLSSILEPPLQSELHGTPITLAQAVDNSLTRSEQTQRVMAYWELSRSAANYYLAFKELSELNDLRQGVAQAGAEWELARQAATDRVQLTLDRARVAQQYLAQLMANTTPGFSPLPSDAPYCGEYETRYQQIFVGRTVPLAEQLHEYLARAHEDLSTRTHEIADARQWMFGVSYRRSPQSDGVELLKSYELFSARRRLFVSSVQEYNLAIVRYTEIATPGTLETDRLVAMLIRTGSSPSTTFDREVQRANAEEGASSNGASTTAPSDGWGSSKQSNTERSILVPRG